MKIKTLLCSIALTALLASCTTVQYQYSEARIAEANTDVFVIPPTARVDVNPILFEDTWTFEGKELNALMYTGINSEVLTQRLKIAAASLSPYVDMWAHSLTGTKIPRTISTFKRPLLALSVKWKSSPDRCTNNHSVINAQKESLL